MSSIRAVCIAIVTVLILLSIVLLGVGPLVAATTDPVLPQVYVDTTYVPPVGRTITVGAGGDFQAALNLAQPGDVIRLQAGASFPPVILPRKSGTGWITIRTSAADSSLPAPGTRIDPSYAAVMPKIMADTSNTPAVQTAVGAHHYRFIGVEVKPPAGAYVHSLVMIGGPELTSADQLPHHIIFDRCYVHGDAQAGGRFGIRLNGAHVAVIDSYVADFKEVGGEAKALAGSNTPGPIKIVNNYLEAAAVNVMFGGSDAVINGVVPSDIEIRRNLFSKPLSWKADDPAYAGTPWSVKNLFELKSAQRVLVEGNVFERSWGDAQIGYALVFTVRSGDEGLVPWSTVSDVTFRNNLVRHAGGGFMLMGVDDNGNPTAGMHRIRIVNNLFADIDPARWNAVGGAEGTFALVISATDGVVFDHNTIMNSGPSAALLYLGGVPHTNFVFRNSVGPFNAYGVRGDGTIGGTPSLDYYAPGFEFLKNLVYGPDQDPLPPNNFPVAFLDGVVLATGVDEPVGSMASTLPDAYRNAGTDGKDIGVDFAALAGAIESSGTIPGITPSSLTLSPASVVGGGASQGKVVLSAPAPAGGTVVSLASSNGAVATVAASVTVPAGSPSATFTVGTQAVSRGTTVTISATYGGVTKSAALSLTVSPPTLSSLTLNPPSVVGGGASQGTVVLSTPAPAGGAVVSLTSSNAAVATVLASVTVPAGSPSATFVVGTQAVTSMTAVTISGAYGGVTKSTALSLTPPPPTLSSLTLHPASVVGSRASLGTVVLSAPAPAGGAVVSLASSNAAAATVATSVTVPAGSPSATFMVGTHAVTTGTTVTISATYGVVTKSDKLRVVRR